MSIHDLANKIKGKGKLDHIRLINILIIVFVGISAFGLGRLSIDKIVPLESGISVSAIPPFENKNNRTTSDISNSTSSNLSTGKYVASKNGKLYYTSNCAGAKRIKDANKVWFDQASDAEKLGYSLSSSCK